MNFYPIPPVIVAEDYVRIPEEVRCTQESEWRGGFTGGYQNIFLEGPLIDKNGDLFITDIPHGQILKVDKELKVSRCIKYDGEPNGMALRSDGKFVVADYKKVSSTQDTCSASDRSRDYYCLIQLKAPLNLYLPDEISKHSRASTM